MSAEGPNARTGQEAAASSLSQLPKLEEVV